VSFDAILKKYSVYILLALVGAIAYFQAAGTTQLLGAALTQSIAAKNFAAMPAAPSAVSGSGVNPKDADAILARNAFDSVTGPLNKKALEANDDQPPALDLSDPMGASACEGIRAAIITESPDPIWSIAALAGTGETTPKMRRIGDEVGGKQIVYIGYNPQEESPSVWLASGAALCQVLLFPRAPAAAPSGSAVGASGAPGEPAAHGPAKIPQDIADRIQKISDTEYQVDRSVVDKVLENQAELMRSARIIPESKDGQTVGVRLFGIRPDTLLGSLGIQNGDRLETINGFSMSSPEKALEAYTRLRAADGLKLQVNRRGQPVTIDIKFK
jgi:general secretion pathway protein C